MKRGLSINWKPHKATIIAMAPNHDYSEISKAIGVGEAAVRGYCSRNGIKINGGKQMIDSGDIDLMVELRLSGVSLDNVAYKFGISYGYACQLTSKRYREART